MWYNNKYVLNRVFSYTRLRRSHNNDYVLSELRQVLEGKRQRKKLRSAEAPKRSGFEAEAVNLIVIMRPPEAGVPEDTSIDKYILYYTTKSRICQEFEGNFSVQGSRFNVQGSTFKVQRSRFNVQRRGMSFADCSRFAPRTRRAGTDGYG